MNTLIFAPGWVHLALLGGLGFGSILLARNAVRSGAVRLGRGLIGLSLAQVNLAGGSLVVTYLVGRRAAGDLGCWVGFAGYALSALAVCAMVVLVLWRILPAKTSRLLQGRDIVALAGLGAIVAGLSFVIHARSVAVCIGSV
jgi:hypothetical protein